MICVGSRWALDWPRYPHLLDATVVALEQEHVVADVAHRCPPTSCYLQAYRKALPLHGRHRYDYRDFGYLAEVVAQERLGQRGSASGARTRATLGLGRRTCPKPRSPLPAPRK